MDKRLVTCAKLCTGDFVCDVGTDHGYLPCFMIKENMCKKALACDVAPMPLRSAEEHINREGLSDRIGTVLSDGLDNVPPEGITDVVMAGMGGELIARLLEKCPWVKNGVNLVLQPMTKWDVLRKWLYDNGFEVKKSLPAQRVSLHILSCRRCIQAKRRPMNVMTDICSSVLSILRAREKSISQGRRKEFLSQAAE